jgi:CO/xanthine dehydrogenase Mo-binding subunit
VQIVLALAAWKTGRPVKIVWSREESIIGHHKRHPFIIRCTWGASRDGRLVGAVVDMTSDSGGYAYTSTKVLGNALLAVLGPYKIPHLHVVGRTVYTNNCPSGAFRGFGGPQGHFAAEGQMNKLAAALGMDPVEFRLRNIWHDGDLLPTRSPLPAGVTIEPVLLEAAARGGWQAGPAGWTRPAARDPQQGASVPCLPAPPGAPVAPASPVPSRMLVLAWVFRRTAPPGSNSAAVNGQSGRLSAAWVRMSVKAPTWPSGKSPPKRSTCPSGKSLSSPTPPK